MKAIVVASLCVLAALSAPAAAQDDPTLASAGSCYIEVPKLMAAPPGGIADLGAALRQLDENLRPQVEEVNRLKAELEQLRLTQQQAVQAEEGEDIDLTRLQADLARVNADLDAKQAQLKADYAAQQAAIVGPVQTRVSERAQAFAAQRKCATLKMARPPDLAALQSAGAQDVTGEFVSWYAANPAS